MATIVVGPLPLDDITEIPKKKKKETMMILMILTLYPIPFVLCLPNETPLANTI